MRFNVGISHFECEPTTIYDMTSIKMSRFMGVQLILWDTPAVRSVESMAYPTYNGTDVYYVVFSLTNKESFSQLDEIMQHLLFRTPRAAFILVGAKSDKKYQRRVLKIEAEALADKFSAKYFELTACQPSVVKEVIEYGVHRAMRAMDLEHLPQVSNRVLGMKKVSCCTII